jgi:hypothetical protein
LVDRCGDSWKVLTATSDSPNVRQLALAGQKRPGEQRIGTLANSAGQMSRPDHDTWPPAREVTALEPAS